MNRGSSRWTSLHALLIVSMLCSLLLGGLIDPADAQASPGTPAAASTGGYVQVSAGEVHTCALTTDDSLECWGAFWPNRPTGTYTQVSAGGFHICAVTTAASLVCEGEDGSGQSSPPTTGTFTQVSAGWQHSCALTTAGSLVCWGYNAYGQASPPTTGTYTQVSAGVFHSCALTTAGSLVCWGSTDNGVATPPTTGTYTQVDAGAFHSCALTTAGSLACWGSNGNYGLATPPTTGTYTQVSAGYDHNCAVTTAGSLACWGDNSDGQATPPTTDTYTQLSAGGHHNCAVTTAADVVCWGDNQYGQATPLRDETPPDLTVPDDFAVETTDADGEVVTYDVTATDDVDGPVTPTCDVPSGSVFPLGDTLVTCIATDRAGNQGQGTFTVTVIDTTAPTGGYAQVSAGYGHTCAVTTRGRLACWGENGYGQAGPPWTGTYTQIDAGSYHSCALTTIGRLVCWGDNEYGRATPPTTSTYTQISTGYYHNCAVTTAGSLVCWGDNEFGRATPPTTGTYTQVDAGDNHNCAVTTVGSLACWGRNGNGRATPPTTGTYTQVSAGYDHSCAVTTAGQIVCWGGNSNSQATPPTTGTYTRVSAGENYNCAVTTAGSLVCWGNNRYGQATPPTTGTYTQVSAGDYHSCALTTAGSLVCWGWNHFGQTPPPQDEAPPVLTVPDDFTVEATAAAGAVVTYDATATDDVDGPLTATCDATSGGTFPLGTTTVTCSATDQAGNIGRASFAVTVRDTTAPVVTRPTLALTTGSARNGVVPVTVAWSGSDAVGITGYRLHLRINGGPWIRQSVRSGATSKRISVPAGVTVEVRLRAIDAAGNLSRWRASAPVATTVIEADDAAVTTTGRWTTGTISHSLDGETLKSNQPNATASVRFTGSSVSWVTQRSPYRGRARVSIDGVYLRTIDLYAATTGDPLSVFAFDGLNPVGNHTLTITVIGTKHPASGGTTVVIDHFIVTGAVIPRDTRPTDY